EAYVSALAAWQRDGVPRSPGAWLTTAARHKALDALRRASTLRRKLPLLVEPVEADATGSAAGQVLEAADGGWGAAGGTVGGAVPDDRLRLLFTCCHPALAPEAQVALTLRLVCGVPTPDVARAFLVPEATMAARITRAKKKIQGARIPYRVPAPAELPERLDSVLTVVHLLFSTGHTAPSGEALVRDDLCERAVDLARTVVALLPDEPEARGLLGLLLLTHARRHARTDPEGRLVLLEDQDRDRWDPVLVSIGLTLTAEALTAAPAPGRFALQAAIAGVHAAAPTFADTQWDRVVGLYDRLLAVWDSPVVALNRAAALAFLPAPDGGPEAALGVVDALAADPRLAGYPYLPAARADLLRRLGRSTEAAAAYEESLGLTQNAAEQAFLAGRLAALR
ncbi:MAG: RNA polymerase sigma factor, partial [Actinobacteria bacterium]|nr:RNA polymerase sigma factor [Actinomycetota bacterium]